MVYIMFFSTCVRCISRECDDAEVPDPKFRLLQTNRQIYGEANHLFYIWNQFFLEGLAAAERFFDRIEQRKLHLIRELTIWVTYADQDHYSDWLLNAIWRIRPMRGLRYLSIVDTPSRLEGPAILLPRMVDFIIHLFWRGNRSHIRTPQLKLIHFENDEMFLFPPSWTVSTVCVCSGSSIMSNAIADKFGFDTRAWCDTRIVRARPAGWESETDLVLGGLFIKFPTLLDDLNFDYFLGFAFQARQAQFLRYLAINIDRLGIMSAWES